MGYGGIDIDKVLVKDDSSKYLQQLSDRERRPELDANKLGPSGPSFNQEEIDTAFRLFLPE